MIDKEDDNLFTGVCSHLLRAINIGLEYEDIYDTLPRFDPMS